MSLPGTAVRTTRWSGRVVVVAALCLLLVVAVYVVGRDGPRVHTDEAGCLAMATQVSCELPDDWTIGVSTDIGWTSVSGVDHEGGRPECLPPTGRGLEGPVALSWVPVEVDGRRWREAVWVTCLD